MKYPTFNFDREKIVAHSDNFSTHDEIIEYYAWLKTEYICNPPKLDPNTRKTLSLVSFLDEQIKFVNGCKERDKKAAEDDDNFCTIVGKVADVVRIFEAMKKTGIIDTATQPMYVARIFFRAQEDQRSFAQSYSNRAKENENLGSGSTSRQLIQFTKELISNSFAGRKDVLSELSLHISSLKKI